MVLILEFQPRRPCLRRRVLSSWRSLRVGDWGTGDPFLPPPRTHSQVNLHGIHAAKLLSRINSHSGNAQHRMGGQIQVSQFLYLLATALSSGWENHEWIFFVSYGWSQSRWEYQLNGLDESFPFFEVHEWCDWACNIFLFSFAMH